MMQVSSNETSLRARDIALQALAGDYDLLLACRDLSCLKGQLPSVADDLMDIFVGVASEIDDLPIGAECREWAIGSRAAKNIEANDYRERVREVVTGALQEILSVLGGTDTAN